MEHSTVRRHRCRQGPSRRPRAPHRRGLSRQHDDAGLATLLTRLRALTPTVIVFEATGGYEVPVAATLASAGLPVAIVNPRQIRHYGRAIGQLAKTDRLDARLIAHFAEAVRPAARPVPDEQAQRAGRTHRPPPPARRDAGRRAEPPAPAARPARPASARRAYRLAGGGPAPARSRPHDPGARHAGVAGGRRPAPLRARASGRSPPARSSPICPNWAVSIAGASPPSSAWRPSRAIAAPSAASG